jgi:hypothetical protein
MAVEWAIRTVFASVCAMLIPDGHGTVFAAILSMLVPD